MVVNITVSRATVDRQTLQYVVDIDKLESKMESAVSTLKWDFKKKLSSRITPAMLDDIEVEFNQKSVPLGQLGHVAAKTPQTMFVNLASTPQVVYCECV
jgi:ribosome recycling factor